MDIKVAVAVLSYIDVAMECSSGLGELPCTLNQDLCLATRAPRYLTSCEDSEGL
jgi:hypothetical protein